jgi:hypothetical protein
MEWCLDTASFVPLGKSLQGNLETSGPFWGIPGYVACFIQKRPNVQPALKQILYTKRDMPHTETHPRSLRRRRVGQQQVTASWLLLVAVITQQGGAPRWHSVLPPS